MSYLKAQFEQYSREHLLTQRARGDDLSDEAHAAIEEIFRERNESLPPRPSSPVHVDTAESGWQQAWGKAAAGVLLFLVAAVVAKVVVNSWLLFPVAAAYGGYYLFTYSRRASLSDEERAAEDFEAEASTRGLTELMKCAISNDAARAQELLNFGTPVDARDSSGATALMYAARNGARNVADALLAAGADRALRTPKGSSAKDIALRHGDADLARLL